MSAAPAIATLDSVGALQRVLYRAAQAQPSRKFHALADKVYRADVLHRAWVDVASNGGAAGVDGVTITDIEEAGVAGFLDVLHIELAAPGRRLWFLARWPSKRAMARARQRIRELTARRLIGASVASIIGRLNRFLAGWAGYFRHGNSARCFDKLQAHAKTRIAIFLGIKHQRGRWWGQRIVYAHPTELGLYQLVGTVKAPRPHQWRHQPRRAG